MLVTDKWFVFGPLTQKEMIKTCALSATVRTPCSLYTSLHGSIAAL